jgi:hypothetical protein
MPITADLICKAVGRGSIAELCEIRKQNNWIAIPIHLITQSCDHVETSLQLSVEKGRYDVVEFLVAELKYQIYPEWKKSMDRVWPNSWPSLNFDRVLPVLAAQSPEMEVIRDISNQIPIINVIEYLIDSTMDEPFQWLEFVLNSIIRSSVSRTDMIVALELIGVALVFKHKNYVWRGLQCWEQAMALRYSSVGVNLPIIPVVPDLESSLLVDGIKVIASPTSLQRFKQEWTRGYSLLLAQTHALIVSHRILSQFGRQVGPNSLHLENLLRYGNRCYYDEQQYSRSLNISLLILKQTGDFNSISSPNCIRIFVETVDLLSNCLKQQQQLPGIQELTFPNLLVVVPFGLAILQNVMLLSPITRTTTDRWQFVIMKKLQHLISQHLQRCGSQVEIQQLKNYLSPYFRANNLNRFTSLLHGAIKGTDEIKKNPDGILPLINLFLESGADPTAIDTNGKAPFQILAENSDWFQFDPESYKQVFQALLDAGCYHKQSISTGKTFLGILNDQKTKYVNKFRFHHYLDPLIHVVLPLSCVCAKVIRQHEISFEDTLPHVLKSFVNRHSATKG